jgi:Ser/Thr protein kinase RdoA (MazF antagonist)
MCYPTMPVFRSIWRSTPTSWWAWARPTAACPTLAAQYEQLLDELDSPTGGDLRRLRRFVPRVAEMCDELSRCEVPETIQHDDLHDGQVFVRDGRYLFFDWGDACVSHPFFTMAVTLEGVIGWGLDDVEGSEDTTPFRDVYLEPFERYATRTELEAAHTAALRLGWICRALNVQRFASALESPYREEHLRGVATRLQLFAAGLA